MFFFGYAIIQIVIMIDSMKEKDIPQVVEIEKLSFQFPKPEAVFQEDEHKYLVAKDDDGKVAGYIGVEKILRGPHHQYGGASGLQGKGDREKVNATRAK